MHRQGSILVGLLWCLVILSLVVVGVLHTSRMDLQVVKNDQDRIQAYYLAVAGIERTKALLYQNAVQRSQSKKNHDGLLYNDPQNFRNIPFGRGAFRLLRRARTDEGGGLLYGVSDEESRLNLNHATEEELTKIHNLTPDLAKAILGWRGDGDPGSAQTVADYYSSLQPPSAARQGPFQSLRELLMVRGVTPALLFGRDQQSNGLLPPRGTQDDEMRNDNVEVEDLGWNGLLTIYSTDSDLDAAGQPRVNFQTADESSLTSVEGITPEIAKAIVDYRKKNQLQSLGDLLDIPLSSAKSGDNANNDGKAISQDLLVEIADEVTLAENKELSGAINLNTASREVLLCLPGVEPELADAIINRRGSNGFFANIAELLRVPGVNSDLFKKLAPLVTTRSETYRILCEGKVKSSGTTQRLEAIIHVGLDKVDTLGWREDNL